MDGYIVLTTAGTETGPFDLYSDADGFTIPYLTGVTREQMLSGINSTTIPDGTNIVRAVSTGVCRTSVNIVLEEPCFKFLPTSSNWALDFLDKGSDGLYYYGNFTGYTYGVKDFTSVRLIKLNENLTIDNNWLATSGLNQVYYSGSNIREQSDGKIIATGTFTTYQGVSANRIVRINTDGSRDTTFNIGAGFNNFTQAPSIDSQGRIIVTGIFGSYNWASAPRIARLLPNGNLDTSFVVGSGFPNTTTGSLVNPDDSMFITGYFNSYKGVATPTGIVKLDANGNRDNTFLPGTGFSPWWADNPQYMMRAPGETSFYVFGYFTTFNGQPYKYIIKLNMDGSIDTSFNAGTGYNALIWMGHMVFGDKLLLTGSYTSYNGIPALYHSVLNPDGSLLWAHSAVDGVVYDDVFSIGNKLYGSKPGHCLKLLYTYEPTTTTTEAPII